MVSQYDAFFTWLGRVESGDIRHLHSVREDDQYCKVENQDGRTGRLGKYQMRAIVLAELGYYTFASEENRSANLWQGFWEGWRGLASTEDFLNNRKAQEYIIREAMNLYWGKIHRSGLDSLVGTIVQGVFVTESNLLAGCHLFGVDDLTFLLNDEEKDRRRYERVYWLLRLFSGFQTPYGERNVNHPQVAFGRYIRKGMTPQMTRDAFDIPYEKPRFYTWRTLKDSKVRASHAANNGKVFDAENPPDTGNPGEAFGCRCWAEWHISSEYLPYDHNRCLNNPARPAKEFLSSAKVKSFIKDWEKFEPYTTLDALGLPTIGYGHRLMPGESFPKGISREEADVLFEKDLISKERVVIEGIKVPITQNQFDAMVSLVFNWKPSSFLRSRMLASLNDGDYETAKIEFLGICYGRNAVTNEMEFLQGLFNRRVREWDMFENGVYDSNH